MTFTSDHIVIFILAAAIVIAAWSAGRKFSRLEAERDAARKEAEQLRQAQPRSYKEFAAIMDSIAIAMDMKQNAESTLDYLNQRTGHLQDILGILRSRPGEYDPNQPNRKTDRR